MCVYCSFYFSDGVGCPGDSDDCFGANGPGDLEDSGGLVGSGGYRLVLVVKGF